MSSARKAGDLLFTMRRRGVRIWAEGGKLRYQSSSQTLTAQDLENLRALKEDLLAFLDQPSVIQKEARPVRRLAADRIPLSFPQQHVWELVGLEKNASIRWCSAAVRLHGRLDLDSLRQSIRILIHRHEALRTKIVVVEGVPEQHVGEAGEYNLDILNLTSLPRNRQEIEARHHVEQIVREPVCVTADPLFLIRLLELGPLCHVLVVATDHLISDAASVGIIWRELFALYSQSVCGQPSQLPEIAIQYPDYSVWQRSTHRAWMQQHHAWWDRRLAGARRLHLSGSETMRHASGIKWGTRRVRFGQMLTNELREVGRRGHSSLVMSVFTVFVAVLSGWCNADDLVLPFGIAGRPFPEIENTIGYFGTPLFLHVEIFAEDTFMDLLARVTGEYAGAYEHDDSWRMSVLMGKPEFIFNPAFNWIPGEFNASAPSSSHLLRGESSLAVAPFDFELIPREDQDPEVELRLDISDSTDGVTGTMGYRPDRLTQGTVEGFAAGLLLFAKKIVEDPMNRVKALSSKILLDTQRCDA